MTLEEKVALTILILALIGLGTVITWTLRLIKFLFIKIFCTYKITITKREPNNNKKKNTITSFPKTNINIDDYFQSAYYLAKKEPYSTVLNDAGKYGEYLIYHYLKDYQCSGGKFLFNCYIPKGEKQTTEIDVILLHPRGIFVFESKNYSGWIFGNEVSDYWTQTLPVRRGESHKERFYNPVKQNNLHIENLKKIVGNAFPIYSIIVFSERCTLKDVNVHLPNVYITNINYVNAILSGIMINTSETLSIEDVNEIFAKLYPYTEVSEEVKRQHIENLNRENANLPFL